jgi:hypothetical protein
MNKELSALKIRAGLERRLAVFLGCDAGDLPGMKIGTLVHVAFLLWGDGEALGGFHSTMIGILQLLGHEVVWAEPKVDVDETAKVVLN